MHSFNHILAFITEKSHKLQKYDTVSVVLVTIPSKITMSLLQGISMVYGSIVIIFIVK